MMSHPALSDWFSISIRRNRKSFIIASVTVLALIFAIALVVAMLDGSGRGKGLVSMVFILLGALGIYFLSAQRLRDMGLTGWLALLWIPIGMLPDVYGPAFGTVGWIILCAVPGTQGPNRYGDDPIEPA